nr:GMC oxidoreductase [Candidatus Pelagisphaera phototrophica]
MRYLLIALIFFNGLACFLEAAESRPVWHTSDSAQELRRDMKDRPNIVFVITDDQRWDQLSEMLAAAGFTNIKTTQKRQAPGIDIHEMGGVRMGKDPKTSLLNKWNQLHACKNVLVTDGACMTSTSTQNPSLTYMAITARAANYAVEEMRKGNV